MTDASPLLTPADFGDFFASVNYGHRPFAWQQRLVDHIVGHGAWPAQVIAPTGAGKSAVVDIHIFVNALAVAGTGPRVPRRLFTVVNRRALVDSQNDRATLIAARLREATDSDEPSLLRTMGELLSSLRTSRDDAAAATAPLAVGLLRGGVPRDNPAVLDPSACAVISATPDMWGSRLLFRGYGASRAARPREAAVAAVDAVMVLDESHLNRQLLVTARRVAELVRMEEDLGVPRLQVVETTATPAAGHPDRVGVESSDFDVDHPLAQRLRASKPLSLYTTGNWLKQASGKRSNKQYIAELSEAVLTVRNQAADVDVSPAADLSGGRTVGCIVNRVNTAVDLSAALKKSDSGLRIRILVGRMRPADLTSLRDEHPGLFTVQGDPEVDVLVATQTLEVGVDVDLAGLVTELASASALTQRFGRVNRLGLRATSPVTVMVPDKVPTKDCLPYTVHDLGEGLEWIQTVAQSVGTVSPVGLENVTAPTPSARRLLYQRPEWTDIQRWSRTNDRLFADDDLDLWLRDDLSPDQAQADIVVRGGLPTDNLAATEVLRAMPPRPEEAFPARIGIARDLVNCLLDGNAGKDAASRGFVVRDGDVLPVTAAEEWSIHPGDTVVVDYGARFTTELVARYPGDASDAPLPVDDPGAVLYADPEFCHCSTVCARDRKDLRREFLGISSDEATSVWNNSVDAAHRSTVILPAVVDDDATEVPWFIVRVTIPADDATVRQQWTPSSSPVALANHNEDVAVRARELASAVGLSQLVSDAVECAGRHHDDGKRDHRFQVMLGNPVPGEHEPLAKSPGAGRRQNRGMIDRAGLPVGWRHEQYSAVLTELARRRGDEAVTDLVLRLVGTSHGHGRNGFPHAGTELLPAGSPPEESEIADDLFTTGSWDDLVERTGTSTGHYAVSYLEEIVRAADNQISKEGR